MPTWFIKIIVIFIMLVAPLGLFPFALDCVNNYDWEQVSQYTYLPEVIIISLIILWVADYTGMIYLIVDWIRNG